MSNQKPSPPHPKLSKIELQQLAKKYRIKNFKHKTPAALRRAIHRYESRLQQKNQQVQATTNFNAQQTSIRQAYKEHRLRYLFAPSRFVHAGTHEEYLLEKEDELLLPDTYLESTLTALPVDPYHFYVYWDFDTPMAKQVQTLFPYYTFVLRTYDVTDIVFNGQNAHLFWDVACHPFALEWYVNTPVSGRNVCIELGFLDGSKFKPMLRSGPLLIPAENVSPVVKDVFGQFVPTAAADAPLAIASAHVVFPVAEESSPVQPPLPQIQELFFQPYQPAPQLPVFRPMVPAPEQPVMVEGVFQPTAPRTKPVFPVATPPAQAPRPSAGITSFITEEVQDGPTVAPLSKAWPNPEIRDGREWMAQWLGAPIAEHILWAEHIPGGVSPFFFHEWVTDPYDQALLVSYSIWPWAWQEYVPLGASDWTVRHFLGASLSSWFRPGASERMIQWQLPAGASEQVQWRRPAGASERQWQQPALGGSEQIWGPAPTVRRQAVFNLSGWGLRP